MMYECDRCGRRFTQPGRTLERHGLDCPPYEQWAVCPHCGSPDIAERRLWGGGYAEARVY